MQFTTLITLAAMAVSSASAACADDQCLLMMTGSNPGFQCGIFKQMGEVCNPGTIQFSKGGLYYLNLCPCGQGMACNAVDGKNICQKA